MSLIIKLYNNIKTSLFSLSLEYLNITLTFYINKNLRITLILK